MGWARFKDSKNLIASPEEKLKRPLRLSFDLVSSFSKRAAVQSPIGVLKRQLSKLVRNTLMEFWLTTHVGLREFGLQ